MLLGRSHPADADGGGSMSRAVLGAPEWPISVNLPPSVMREFWLGGVRLMISGDHSKRLDSLEAMCNFITENQMDVAIPHLNKIIDDGEITFLFQNQADAALFKIFHSEHLS
jgi:hypothetical protein